MTSEFDRDIQRACEPFRQDHDRLRAELMASLPAEASEGGRPERRGRRWRLLGNLLMKHRFFTIGIPAAAAVAVVLLVGLWPQLPGQNGGVSSGRVYGAADIPELLRSAEVLHVHEVFNVPGDPVDVKQRKIGADYWVDRVNGRWHLWYTDLGLTEGNKPPADMEDRTYRFLQRVSDGEYVMELWYDQPVFRDDVTVPKMGKFTRLTPFMADLETTFYHLWCTPFADELQDPETLAGYYEAGQEVLDGDTFTIWQREYPRLHLDPATQTFVQEEGKWGRTKVWLSPTTGTVARLESWKKGPSTDNSWILSGVTDVVERDVVPPPGVFETVAPPEFEMTNTKATAPVRSIAEESDHYAFHGVHLRVHMETMLNDGSVIVGWSSWEDDADESQAPLFEPLTPGGPLPALPIEIRSFTHPTTTGVSYTYTGRHLAWTQKDGRCYEWAVYVPDQARPASEMRLGRYVMNYVLNTDRTTRENVGTLYHFLAEATVYPSTDVSQFNRWVRRAMADLSDDGIAPDHVTYEYVMGLCDQTRASLNTP